VGPGGVGEPERHLRPLLRDGRPVPQVCIEAAKRGHVSDGLCLLAFGADNRECISRATGDDPAGPFVDDSTAPFICPVSQGGAIDPSVFSDSDGTTFLLWKSDGEAHGLPTDIYSQQLSPDGLSTVGPPHFLITATQRWEDGNVEGPSMVKNGSSYWLFYSANNWDTPDYAVGIARCRSVEGPCTKPLSKPWLSSTSQNHADSQGPGGQEFFQLFGTIWMIHHGWLPGQAGTRSGQRRLYVDLLDFNDPAGLPQLGPPPLAAALAAVFAQSNGADPSKPTGTFLRQLRSAYPPAARQSEAALIAQARRTCSVLGGLPHGDGQLIDHVAGASSATFSSDLVFALAIVDLCHQYANSAILDLHALLYPDSVPGPLALQPGGRGSRGS